MAAHTHDDDSPCDVPHRESLHPRPEDRELVVTYATPLARHLLSWGHELGFRTVLLEPDVARVTADHRASADVVLSDPQDVEVGDHADVVVTDHHRDDLGRVMAPLVTAGPRWIGIIGSPRHAGPHGPALAAEGVDAELITTVQRPIGLDIGSRTPPEIALSVLAGLLADRRGRTGGLPSTAVASP